MLTRRHAILATAAAAGGCARKTTNMNDLAERYVKLILGIGHHDPNYVDAYYGPPEWKPAKQPLEQLATEASTLTDAIAQQTGGDLARQNYLVTQTRAAASRIRSSANDAARAPAIVPTSARPASACTSLSTWSW